MGGGALGLRMERSGGCAFTMLLELSKCVFAYIFVCVGCGSDYHFVVPGQQGAEACHDPGARKDRGISTSLVTVLRGSQEGLWGPRYYLPGGPPSESAQCPGLWSQRVSGREGVVGQFEGISLGDLLDEGQ